MFGDKEEAVVHFQLLRTLHFLQKHTFENFLTSFDIFLHMFRPLKLDFRFPVTRPRLVFRPRLKWPNPQKIHYFIFSSIFHDFVVFCVVFVDCNLRSTFPRSLKIERTNIETNKIWRRQSCSNYSFSRQKVLSPQRE